MVRTAAAFLVLSHATVASATTATDTFTATLPTATETFTLPTGGETATHTFTLPTSTATFANFTYAPTNSPTMPTTSPSMAPSAAPSGSPTGAPSQSPSMAPTGTPTKSPTKAPTTKSPTEPDTAPVDAPEETEQPTTAFPTQNPSQSPTKTGDTISPSTAMPTSTTDPAAVLAKIESLLNTPIAFTFGGVSYNITMTTATMKEVNGAAVYTTTLAETLTAAQVNDTTENGFVHTLSIALANQAGITPASRIPYQTMAFTNVAAGRRSRTLGSGVTFSVCNAVQNGVCVTYSPTGSPTTPPTNKWAADDDFPGWAIALCVVLPVLAIGAGVAVWMFVCKSDAEPEEVASQSSDKPNPNEPTADEQKDSQV